MGAGASGVPEHREVITTAGAGPAADPHLLPAATPFDRWGPKPTKSVVKECLTHLRCLLLPVTSTSNAAG
jgi:hypothetical protein